GGESTGDEGMGAGPRDEEQRQSQRRDEQAETDWPELRQRLEIEAVRVANVRRASSVLEPVLLEGPGAGAQCGVRLPVAPGRPPEGRPPAQRELEPVVRSSEGSMPGARRSGVEVAEPRPGAVVGDR